MSRSRIPITELQNKYKQTIDKFIGAPDGEHLSAVNNASRELLFAIYRIRGIATNSVPDLLSDFRQQNQRVVEVAQAHIPAKADNKYNEHYQNALTRIRERDIVAEKMESGGKRAAIALMLRETRRFAREQGGAAR